MQLLLFFHSIPLVLVLRYHLFFNLMNVMIRDTHHHSHLWTCDWQPPPFYLRLGEYLLDSWLHDAWLIAWQPSARLTTEPTIPWDQSLRGIGENWWRHSRESGRSNLVCGILSRIQWLNDCDVLQTPEGGALVTDAKESLDSIPAWSRTDRWIAVPWQGALNISTERMGGSHWQRWNPCIQLAMEGALRAWRRRQ